LIVQPSPSCALHFKLLALVDYILRKYIHKIRVEANARTRRAGLELALDTDLGL